MPLVTAYYMPDVNLSVVGVAGPWWGPYNSLTKLSHSRVLSGSFPPTQTHSERELIVQLRSVMDPFDFDFLVDPDFLVAPSGDPLRPPGDLFDFDFTYDHEPPPRSLTPQPPSELPNIVVDSSLLSLRHPNVRRGRQRNPSIKYAAVKFAQSCRLLGTSTSQILMLVNI